MYPADCSGPVPECFIPNLRNKPNCILATGCGEHNSTERTAKSRDGLMTMQWVRGRETRAQGWNQQSFL